MKTKKIDHRLLRMIVFMIILLSLFLLNSVKAQEINIDSMYYSDVDSTALAKAVEIAEADYHWTDTLDENSFKQLDASIYYMEKKFRNIESLAQTLTAGLETDDEKIRAFFIWITGHIAYDYVLYEKMMKKNEDTKKFYFKKTDSPAEKVRVFEKHYYNYASKVLKNKRGVCEGYATLFYELCRYANIPCAVVTGYADKNEDKVALKRNKKSFYTNHAWNMVKLHDEWLYLDVTWASTGTYSGRRTEPTGINLNYYLVPMNKLFPTHAANEKQTKKRNELVGNYSENY
jgi:transglutaminase/protease-like cytokinesis protein 3